MKSVVVDPSALRLGRRRAAAAAVGADDHLRDARRAASRAIRAPASAEKTRGTYAGLIEKIPYLQRPRHHRGRAAAGVPVRRAGLPAGAGQLLGLPAGLVLRAAPGLQLAPGPARAGRRVPRHGQGAAPRGHRGHPRRRLQPHRRGRPRRADALLPRARQPDLLHPRAGPRALRRLQRLRQHAQRQPPDRPPDDRGQPALLGARRCTWTGSASTWRRSSSRDSSGHVLPNPPVLWDIESDPALAGTKLIAEAWDAAGLYQVGSFVGDSWKEWNGRFRDDVRELLPRRARRRCGASPTGWSAAPSCTATRSASPSRASTSSPATTASR